MRRFPRRQRSCDFVGESDLLCGERQRPEHDRHHDCDREHLPDDRIRAECARKALPARYHARARRHEQNHLASDAEQAWRGWKRCHPASADSPGRAPHEERTDRGGEEAGTTAHVPPWTFAGDAQAIELPIDRRAPDAHLPADLLCIHVRFSFSDAWVTGSPRIALTLARPRLAKNAAAAPSNTATIA